MRLPGPDGVPVGHQRGDQAGAGGGDHVAAIVEDGVVAVIGIGDVGGGTGYSSWVHLDDAAIHAALEQGKTEEFESTTLYQAVFALAAQAEGGPLPRAVVPQIRLEGPKISRNLTTDWYARRVDERFRGCLAR